MKRIGLLMLLSTLTGVALARDWPQMRDEADKGLPPWIQYYDRLKGEPKLGPLDQHLSEPESLNVKLVGKWGRGPAARVTGRDTLVYLALGSEVAIFNCVNAHNPTIVNEIQCRYVVDRPILEDSILYCVLQGGVEVFNIANPASPTKIKYLPITAVDMCINDTMAYTIDTDSFKAYRIVAPDSFQRLGACADSGYYIAADSGFAYLCDRWGLYVIDATDPTSPHQVSVVTGAHTWAVLVDSGCCYYTTGGASDSSFQIADVSNPYAPYGVGSIAGIASYDLYKLSYFVYLPGYYILDVSTPNFPTEVGSTTYGGNGVWTRSPFSYSFIAADYNGFATINITDPTHPALDTSVAAADWSYGVCTDGNWSYVANYYAGMRVLNDSNPGSPREVGAYDTAGPAPEAKCVVARDSFAYLGTDALGPTGFRVIDVSHKDNPVPVAALYSPNFAGGVVLRDSLVYYAIDLHFYVISIANPQNPRLVGSCGLPDNSYGLAVRDSLAYVANGNYLVVVNVANPANPDTIGSMRPPGGALDIALKDTFAFVASGRVNTVDIANPAAPYLVATCSIPTTAKCIALDGNLVYVGECPYSTMLRVFDISDPTALVQIGYRAMPSNVWRVQSSSPYVYAACLDGGVCIVETASTSGVAEASPVPQRPQAFELTPNPASSYVNIRLEVTQNTSARNSVRFYDAAGRVVLDVPYVSDRGQQPRSQRVDISTLPDGCYFVAVEPTGQGRVQKVIKTGKGR
jgi:hypothetical protein